MISWSSFTTDMTSGSFAYLDIADGPFVCTSCSAFIILGLLCAFCISAIAYVLIVYPAARAWLAWAFTEALIWGISLPALCASAYFLFNYLSTVCIRPNATRVHWSTVAFGHGVAASFFLLLADEKIEQTRGSDDVSIFSLFSSWGASTFFFYVVFAVLSSRWNHSRFNAQVRGLDLRDLASEQFDAFGRLVDKSFQVPREMQDMAT